MRLTRSTVVTAATVGWRGRRLRPDGREHRDPRHVGHLLVPIDDLHQPERTVDVASFAALAAIAVSDERRVLFGDSAGLRVYLVPDDGVPTATTRRRQQRGWTARRPSRGPDPSPRPPARRGADSHRQRAVPLVEECTPAGSGTTWTCPVPGRTVPEATAGSFEWVPVS